MTRYQLLDRCGNVVHDGANLNIAIATARLWSVCGYKTVFHPYTVI